MLREILGEMNALTDRCSVEENRELGDNGGVADVILADDWLVVFGEVIAGVVELLPSCDADVSEILIDAEDGVAFCVTLTVTSGSDELLIPLFETVDIVGTRLPESGVAMGGIVELGVTWLWIGAEKDGFIAVKADVIVL